MRPKIRLSTNFRMPKIDFQISKAKIDFQRSDKRIHDAHDDWLLKAKIRHLKEQNRPLVAQNFLL